jgi:hypothetical protein
MLLTFILIFLFEEDFLGGGEERESFKGVPSFLRATNLAVISHSRGKRM